MHLSNTIAGNPTMPPHCTGAGSQNLPRAASDMSHAVSPPCLSALPATCCVYCLHVLHLHQCFSYQRSGTAQWAATLWRSSALLWVQVLLARACVAVAPAFANQYYGTCAVGFSAVLFALKVVLNSNSPGCSSVAGISLPTKGSWPELYA